MQKRRFRRLLLIATGIIGIIGVLVISLVVLFSYTPDTSVPFPYIPPPEKGYYIETTTQQLSDEFYSPYLNPATAEIRYVGESFILKNILIDERKLSARYKTYIYIDLIQCVPQNPSDLKKLKEGDVVDIIGVCTGLSKEYPGVVVLSNCQFLPAGLAPLPLPGGPVFVGGY